jgi:hypothetical protein
MKSTQKDSIQKDTLTAFFEELLLEHGGAYTLFGSKPITIEELYEPSEDTLKQVNQYLQEHPEIESVMVDRHLEEGWNEWKKMKSITLSQNYVLKDMQLGESRILIFANIPNTIEILKKHYADFKQAINHDFIPVQLIGELKKGKLESWRKILLNRKTLGILTGYGYRNASLFASCPSDILSKAEPSENNDPRLPAECVLNNKPFRIPLFVMLDEEESKFLLQRYKREREAIKQKYAGKNFLQVTLQQLSG